MTEREEWGVTAPSFIGEPPLGRFLTETEGRNEGQCSASCRISLDSLVAGSRQVRTTAAGLHRRGRAWLTSDWCSGWSRSPQNSWNEEEKSLMHDTCGAGEQVQREQQEGWAEEQKGGGGHL